VNAVRRYGQHALLVTPPPPAAPIALAGAIAAARRVGVVEVVPAAETVLVAFSAPVHDDDVAWLEGLAPGDVVGGGETVEIDVVYDGDDLADVALRAGLSVAEVIQRHTAGEYRVEFCGFAPGFGYLSGLDPALVLPRRATPRTRVPAGSIAIAGPYSAAYPTPSPGGWHLLGRTDAALWDPRREPPALLAPGAVVRFRPVDELRRSDDDRAAATTTATPATDPVLDVVAAGMSTTIQDLGRPGFQALGVPRSGALDGRSAALANRLVGNEEGGALFETAGGLVVEAVAPVTIADSATGAVRSLRAGERIVVEPRHGQAWAYLAVRGGLLVGAELGSRSTDTLSRLGPRGPRAGDRYGVGPEPAAPIVVDQAPPDVAPVSVDVVVDAGPRQEWFAAASVEALLSAPWRVSAERSRVGVRLDGPALERDAAARGRELASEGMVPGAIQVPPDGRPVVLLRDHPATGGYPVIAVVDEADVARIAQLPAGGVIRFRGRR